MVHYTIISIFEYFEYFHNKKFKHPGGKKKNPENLRHKQSPSEVVFICQEQIPIQESFPTKC